MKRMRKTKTILVLAAVVLMLACTVGGTLAFLITKTNSVTNTFDPGRVTCEVVETFANNTKSVVTIKNTGNTKAWIRATVVANWVVGSGSDAKVVAPWTGSITYNSTNWDKVGDYYYYKTTVASGDTTKNLLSKDFTPGTAPVTGAHLEMTIVCQAVQSNLGSTAQLAFAAAASVPSGT